VRKITRIEYNRQLIEYAIDQFEILNLFFMSNYFKSFNKAKNKPLNYEIGSEVIYFYVHLSKNT